MEILLCIGVGNHPRSSGRSRGGVELRSGGVTAEGAWNCGQGGSNPIAKNCGKKWENCGKLGEIGGKLWYRNQTSQTLQERRFCTRGSECFCVSSNMVHRYRNYCR